MLQLSASSPGLRPSYHQLARPTVIARAIGAQPPSNEPWALMGRVVQEEKALWGSEEKRALIHLAAAQKSGLTPAEFDVKLQVKRFFAQWTNGTSVLHLYKSVVVPSRVMR